MSMSKFTKKYFQECGRRGGEVRSKRKTDACRANARKPRKKKDI